MRPKNQPCSKEYMLKLGSLNHKVLSFMHLKSIYFANLDSKQGKSEPFNIVNDTHRFVFDLLHTIHDYTTGNFSVVGQEDPLIGVDCNNFFSMECAIISTLKKCLPKLYPAIYSELL